MLNIDHKKQAFEDPEGFEDDPTPYPTSDDRPMGETDLHRNLMIDLIHALEVHFQFNQEVYVSGNILLFYEKGNRRRHVSPDVLVTLGVTKKMRQNYKVWEEGKAPDLVVEVTSASTRSEDMGEKKGLYALMGVRELVLFDPREEYLKPRLRLYRLREEDYVPVVPPTHLESVNLDLVLTEQTLRLQDPKTGQLLPTRADTLAQADKATQAQQETQAEKARADEAVAKARALEAELVKLRGG